MNKAPLKRRICKRMEDNFHAKGIAAFWPSNFRDMGTVEEIAGAFLGLLEDTYIMARLDIYCPESHRVISGATARSLDEIQRCLETYATETCDECEWEPELQEFDPDECMVEMHFVLSEWFREELQRQKKKGA